VSDAPVLAFDDLTYTRSQVEALSAGLADTLSQRGVHAGQRVALMSSNRPEFVFAVQAIWQLAEDVHAIAAVLAMVRTGTPLASAVRNARVWGKRQSALERAVQRVAPAALPGLLLAVARLDALSKGLGRGNAWSELAGIGLALCGKPLFAST